MIVGPQESPSLTNVVVAAIASSSVVAAIVSGVISLLASRNVEKLKAELSLKERQRQASAALGEFLHFAFFEYPQTRDLGEFAKRYWALTPWLSRRLVVELSHCVAENGQFEGDVRRMLEIMRRDISGERLVDKDIDSFKRHYLRVERDAGKEKLKAEGT